MLQPHLFVLDPLFDRETATILQSLTPYDGNLCLKYLSILEVHSGSTQGQGGYLHLHQGRLGIMVSCIKISDIWTDISARGHRYDIGNRKSVEEKKKKII